MDNLYMITLIENQLLTHLFFALLPNWNAIYIHLFFVTTHEKEIELFILEMF